MHTKLMIKSLYVITLPAVIALTVVAQEKDTAPGERSLEQFLKVQEMFTRQVNEKAAEPFVGLTTDGAPIEGLSDAPPRLSPGGRTPR